MAFIAPRLEKSDRWSMSRPACTFGRVQAPGLFVGALETSRMAVVMVLVVVEEEGAMRAGAEPEGGGAMRDHVMADKCVPRKRQLV